WAGWCRPGPTASPSWFADLATPVPYHFHACLNRIRRGTAPIMGVRETFLPWPALRQGLAAAAGRGDASGRGASVRSAATDRLTPRTATADRVVGSVCPYCAVGCGQLVYVKDEQIVQIEGDPASPVSRGRLCPKGSATKQLVTNPRRETKVRYRRPFGTEWEDLDL